MLKVQLLLLIGIVKCLSSKAPTVVTHSGTISGHYLTSFKGNKYEAYQGIPYALPPIEERRFKSPTPTSPWSGELIATHLRPPCCQNVNPSGHVREGDEDCLYLNVFVPQRKSNETLPVVFWIHGGGFQWGGNLLDEEIYLMDYEVVLVTVQFRLGVLGFLSTEDEVVSGNMGLKDQSLALRWIYENIEYFNGDPNRITLFGQSSGYSILHYHYLSPMSAGLFQNGISVSGTAFNFWAQAKHSRQKALKLGKLMNCTTKNTEEMIHCLRQQPARDLVNLQDKFQPWRMTPPSPFGPVVEKFARDPFIESSPREIIKRGKVYDVPWITGVVSEEGLYPGIAWVDDTVLKEINDNWNRIAPLMLGFYYTALKENHARVAQTIRKYYFRGKSINKDTFMTLIHLIGDRWKIADAGNAAKAHAKAIKSPVRFYYYNYRAVDTICSELLNSTKVFGVCDADDAYLIMKDPLMNPTKSSRDMAMQRVLINFLTSFARNNSKQDLNVKWSKVNPNGNLKYLKISGPEDTKIKMKRNSNLGRTRFWNSINVDGN